MEFSCNLNIFNVQFTHFLYGYKNNRNNKDANFLYNFGLTFFICGHLKKKKSGIFIHNNDYFKNKNKKTK